MLTFPSVEPFRHQSAPYVLRRVQDLVVRALGIGESQNMSSSSTYCTTDNSEPWVLCKSGNRPRRLSREHYLRADGIEEVTIPNIDPHTIARSSFLRSCLNATLLDESRAASPSPTEVIDSFFTIHLHRLATRSRKIFSVTAGRVTQMSLVVAMSTLITDPSCGAEQDPWGDESSPKPATVLIRYIDPQALEGFEQLGLSDRNHDAAD